MVKTATERVKRPRGRPSVSESGETEGVYFRAAREEMDRVHAELARLGAGASLAGWMRDAIREKLERDRPAEE